MLKVMEFRHCGHFFKSLWAGWPKKVGNFYRDSSRVRTALQLRVTAKIDTDTQTDR